MGHAIASGVYVWFSLCCCEKGSCYKFRKTIRLELPPLSRFKNTETIFQ